MKYGYFDHKAKEYVITTPKTPTKWINYLGTIKFGGIADHTGGALICKGDPATNRITKYIPQLPDSDFKGSTLYLRFSEGDHHTVFSPFFVPTLDPYKHYECHIGLGYTRIVSDTFGIRTEVTIFVPLDGYQVLRDIKITNLRDKLIEIDAIPVVEYTHPDALKQFTNADWVPQTMQSRIINQEYGFKVLEQYPFMYRDSRINYFTSNLPVSSFDSDRKVFLGDNGYGTWADPLSLQLPELNNSEAHRGDNIAALMHHLGEFAPGETKRLITQLGQDTDIQTALPSITKFRDPINVDAAFQALKQFWQTYLERLQVETPDSSTNHMLNVHNPHQCYITKNWSRYLSLYQLGLGQRGIGFRDSSQDVLGMMAHAPEEGRDLIRMLLSVQKRDGSAMHQFNPTTMVANEGDSREVEDGPTFYSDDHLWIIQSICSYLKETGDVDFLGEYIPFYEKDKKDNPIENGTILDHMQRSIEFTRVNVGAHGLPLLGFADWNDTVNLASGAESVFTACLYGKALLEMMALFQHLGLDEPVKVYSGYYQEMKERVNIKAWDGGWYRRYSLL
jgi:cellobiose phosphorylase